MLSDLPEARQLASGEAVDSRFFATILPFLVVEAIAEYILKEQEARSRKEPGGQGKKLLPKRDSQYS